MELGDQKYSGYSSLNHFTIIFLLPLPSVDYMTTIDQIPYPSYTSWMHQRILLPKESMPSKKARYAATRPPDRLIEGLASRLFRMIYHFLNRNVWGIYRIVMAIEWWFYRANQPYSSPRT